MQSQLWRLNRLYTVVDEHGKLHPFRMRPTQAHYYFEQWYFDIILKSRQHGFSTLILLMMLDACMFIPNYTAHTIAHRDEDAERLFWTKVKAPYEALPQALFDAGWIPRTVKDSARGFAFTNGSRISLGGSGRSGTINFLHVSEHGKLCAQFAHRAKEVRTGSLNAVHEGNRCVIESTAEGKKGDFYEFATQAGKHVAGRPRGKRQYKLHFYAWFQDRKNVTDPRYVTLRKRHAKYFAELKKEHGIKLTPGQKAWYADTEGTQRDLMFREHPSAPQEAFFAATEGKILAGVILQMRRNHQLVPKLPIDPRFPVNTGWDIGRNDETAIWFHQCVLGEHKLVGYYENRNQTAPHYVNVVNDWYQEKGAAKGRHFLPHDGENTDWSNRQDMTRIDTLRDLGLGLALPVERVKRKIDGIYKQREFLPQCMIDETECEEGIGRLEDYRFEEDEKTGSLKDTPFHDKASNAADALETLARGWIEETKPSKPRKRSWRTA